MKNVKVIMLSVMVLALVFAVADCYAGCCEPCIDVSVCTPPCPGCNSIEVWTWNPVNLFPQNPNLQIAGCNIEANRPYLFKAWVKNNSNIEVHGVQVVFYWASWGLFDTGTPIGSVAVDLLPNQLRLVSGPPTSDLNPAHVCVGVRIFHPCDKNLGNNYCQRNLNIVNSAYPFTAVVLPFIMDFNELKGKLNFKIEAPRGIYARIITREVKEEETTRLKDEKGVESLEIKPGFVKKCTLLIRNAGADYKPGSSFDVTVSAYQDNKLISVFTVRVNITK